MKPFTTQAEIFKALGHPVRLRIVMALRDGGEACVCHLEHDLGLRQAYLSQHLAKLRAAGLVSDQRVGSNVFYALAGGWVAELLSTLETETCPRCVKRQASANGSLTSRPGRSIPA